MQRCLDVIDSQAEEALRSDSFIEIDYQTLEQILGRDTLRTNETIVFEAATRWAEAECTRQGRDVDSEQCREVLRDALYLLRLPTMSLNEFANGALQSGVLSKQEIIDIVSFFGADNKPKLPFPTTCRKGKNIKTCSRFHSTKYNWGFSVGRVNGITFSVDKAISVVGFGLYGSSKAAEYKVGIGLKHSDGTVLCEESHMMSYDSSNNTTHVMFDRPVRIKADTYYTARFVEGSNGPGYYGADGICYVKYDNINFTFAECMDLLNPTTVSKGQIPEILFYRWPDHGSVANHLRALESVRANDVLQLDCKLLNISANALAPALAHLFNLSLQMQFLSNDWKLARVTPIYKGKGDVSAETNYRPISVISHARS